MCVRIALLLSLLLGLPVGAGCAGHDRAPTLDETLIARRLHKDPTREVLLVRSETPGASRVVTRTRDGGRVTVLADGVVDAVWGGGKLFYVSATGELMQVANGERKTLMSGAQEGLALLGDGTLIAVIGQGDQTDLWRVDPRGFTRPFASSEARDSSPLALDDGRVAFVSWRDGAPALYTADPFGGPARRLSSLAGGPSSTLVQQDGAIVFTDTADQVIRVALPAAS